MGELIPGQTPDNQSDEIPENKRLTPRDDIRKKLNEFESAENEIFRGCLEHSEDYIKALGILPDEVSKIEDMQGYAGTYPTPEDWAKVSQIMVAVGKDQFAIIAKKVCCHQYGKFTDTESWKDLLIAIALNPDFNKEIGQGTTWINVISEDWHIKVVAAIKGERARNDQAESSLDDIDERSFNGIDPRDIIGPDPDNELNQ